MPQTLSALPRLQPLSPNQQLCSTAASSALAPEPFAPRPTLQLAGEKPTGLEMCLFPSLPARAELNIVLTSQSASPSNGSRTNLCLCPQKFGKFCLRFLPAFPPLGLKIPVFTVERAQLTLDFQGTVLTPSWHLIILYSRYTGGKGGPRRCALEAH